MSVPVSHFSIRNENLKENTVLQFIKKGHSDDSFNFHHKASILQELREKADRLTSPLIATKKDMTTYRTFSTALFKKKILPWLLTSSLAFDLTSE